MSHITPGAAGSPHLPLNAHLGTPGHCAPLREPPSGVSQGRLQGVRRVIQPLSPEASEPSGLLRPVRRLRVAPPPRLPFRHWQQQGRIPYAIEASQFAAAYRRVFKQEPPRCTHRKQTRAYGLWELEPCLWECWAVYERRLVEEWGVGGRMLAALLEMVPGPRYRQILERHAGFHPIADQGHTCWQLVYLEVSTRAIWWEMVRGSLWRIEAGLRALGLGSITCSLAPLAAPVVMESGQ